MAVSVLLWQNAGELIAFVEEKFINNALKVLGPILELFIHILCTLDIGLSLLAAALWALLVRA
jgi:hypothetical protein